MKNLILLLITIFLSTLKSIAQEPTYKIIFLDQYYTEYIEISKESNEDQKELFLKQVRTPIFYKHFINSEYSPFVYKDLARPSLDIPYLEKTIKAIIQNKKQIEKIITTSLKECNQLLKNNKMTVYVMPPSSESKTMIKNMSGVFGFTAGSSQILINLDPNIKDWQKMLPYAIAHEYNHTYWTMKNLAAVTSWSLLDYLIFEGKGDYFAKQLYPNVNTPWTQALTEGKKHELWLQLQPYLKNQDFNFQEEVIFGSKQFPTWGGYTLGYDIVQSSLSNDQSIAPETWINFSSEHILKSSNYQKKQ